MTPGAGASARSDAPGPPRGERALGLLLVLAGLPVAGTGMARDLDGPWQRGWKAHNGGRYAHIAGNYARWGFTHAGKITQTLERSRASY